MIELERIANQIDPAYGAGFGAAPWRESVVQGLQVSLAVAILAGTVSVIYALRPKPGSAG